jgi:hypothetical protein
MKSKELRGLQAFRRVDAWFAEHPQVIANSGSSQAALASQVDALKQVVDAMTASATDQTTQANQATLVARDEKQLRTELRSLHVRTIVKIASALRGRVPGMGTFKSPSLDLSAEPLLHAADAIRTTAAIYKDVFVEHGLPADFLEQLDAAMAALKASVDARGVARSRIAGATTTLASERSLGLQIVTMIDATLAHALKSDPATLASWHQAKRVTVKGVTSRAIGSAGPISPTVVPVANSAGSPASTAATTHPPQEIAAA